MGIMLIILGILVFTNSLSILGNFRTCQRDHQNRKGTVASNKDNLSALLTGIGVVALIVGFAIYFNQS